MSTLPVNWSCSRDDIAKPSMTPATMDRLRSCSERSLCGRKYDNMLRSSSALDKQIINLIENIAKALQLLRALQATREE